VPLLHDSDRAPPPEEIGAATQEVIGEIVAASDPVEHGAHRIGIARN
jgi:hypothetical protein